MQKKIIFVQDWAEIIDTIWPDLTEEDLAMWKDVGVAFKMRRRYQKFVLLYYVPRFPQLFALPSDAFSYFQPILCCLFLGVILDYSSGKAKYKVG